MLEDNARENAGASIILQKNFQPSLECLLGEFVRAGRICKGVSVSTCSIFVVTHPEYHQLCTAAGFPCNVELQG